MKMKKKEYNHHSQKHAPPSPAREGTGEGFTNNEVNQHPDWGLHFELRVSNWTYFKLHFRRDYFDFKQVERRVTAKSL